MNKNILTIDNFKCFKHLEIVLPNLTILVGSNGMGKSTIIQSLLLIRSAWEKENDALELNGPYGLSLGTNASVLNQEADDSVIQFQLRDESGEIIAELRLIADTQEEELKLKKEYRGFYTLDGIFHDEFYFLSAERTGPRISQKMEPLPFNYTGIYGEHTGQLLAERFLKIEENRRHPKSGAPYLPVHVNAWMNEILPGVDLTADKNISMQTSQIRIRNKISSEYVESTNIGFGISYSLPIVVQGLVAEQGRYFLVENPEAHLHPAAQTKMGEFLAMLAEKGLRVIIETHSDHLLDGIQLYAASHPEMRKDITIYNFGLDEEQEISVSTIEYDNEFDYTRWPDGFMDQTNKNFKKFNEIR